MVVSDTRRSRPSFAGWPTDLKYGQPALKAGEYRCTRCGAVHIFRREEVAGPCRECGGTSTTLSSTDARRKRQLRGRTSART